MCIVEISWGLQRPTSYTKIYRDWKPNSVLPYSVQVQGNNNSQLRGNNVVGSANCLKSSASAYRTELCSPENCRDLLSCRKYFFQVSATLSGPLRRWHRSSTYIQKGTSNASHPIKALTIPRQRPVRHYLFRVRRYPNPWPALKCQGPSTAIGLPKDGSTAG